MAEQPPANLPTTAAIQSSLHELAQVLRRADHLEPEAQQAVADLMDALGRALGTETAPPAELGPVATEAAQLARALQHRHNPTLLTAAKERLQKAALRAETAVPAVTAIVQRLLETLADFGI
jgi:hypothetical protein